MSSSPLHSVLSVVTDQALKVSPSIRQSTQVGLPRATDHAQLLSLTEHLLGHSEIKHNHLVKLII